MCVPSPPSSHAPLTPQQHTIAALRTLLPAPLTHLSAHATLAKPYLAPHDTIHAIVRAGSIHGSATLTWAHPTQAKPTAEAFVVTGSNGWVSVNQAGGKWTVHVTSATTGTEEKVEEFVEEGRGVQVELAAFFAAIHAGGGEGALEIGDPLEALRDVAFIEAALGSVGKEVDLRALVRGA